MQAAVPVACFLSLIRPPGVQFESSLLQILPVDKSKCPFVRDHTDISFQLFTRHNPTVYEELKIGDDEKLFASSIDLNDQTVLYFHAFMEQPDDGSGILIREAYMQRGDTNIIMIDARQLEAGPWYPTAAQNTWYIGNFAAQFIDYLVSRGLDLQKTHLVGHSLGAQSAGVAGSTIKSGRVSRITGLDPALPLFNGLSEEQRLDPTDADFVDVIHTDAGIFGVKQPLGHVDFYPNGGLSPQPGCELKVVIPEQMLLNTFFCSHWRSYRFYAESVLRPNAFVSTKCSSWYKYSKGGCVDDITVNMGYGVDSKHNPTVYEELKIGDDEKLFASSIDLNDQTVLYFHAFMEQPDDGSGILIREGNGDSHKQGFYTFHLKPIIIDNNTERYQTTQAIVDTNTDPDGKYIIDVTEHKNAIIKEFDDTDIYKKHTTDTENRNSDSPINLNTDYKQLYKDVDTRTPLTAIKYTKRNIEHAQYVMEPSNFENKVKNRNKSSKLFKTFTGIINSKTLHELSDRNNQNTEDTNTQTPQEVLNNRIKEDTQETRYDTLEEPEIKSQIKLTKSSKVANTDNANQKDNFNIKEVAQFSHVKSHLLKRGKRSLSLFNSENNFLFRILNFLTRNHKSLLPVITVMREINTLVKSGNGEINNYIKEENSYIGTTPYLSPVTYSLELNNESRFKAFVKRLLGLSSKGDRITITGTH